MSDPEQLNKTQNLTTKMNSTGIELYIDPRDEEEFEDINEVSTTTGAPSGLLNISSGVAHPSDLLEVTHCRFVGMHGSHAGDYPANLVWCFGDNLLHSIPCDESGNVSIPGFNPWICPGSDDDEAPSLREIVDAFHEAKRALWELIDEAKQARE